MSAFAGTLDILDIWVKSEPQPERRPSFTTGMCPRRQRVRQDGSMSFVADGAYDITRTGAWSVPIQTIVKGIL